MCWLNHSITPLYSVFIICMSIILLYVIPHTEQKPCVGVCYLGKEGLSPASKASLNCLTALSWPGRRKMPSSSSPCSFKYSTHFCTRIGTMRGPKRCSYVTMSLRLFPNTAGTQRNETCPCSRIGGHFILSAPFFKYLVHIRVHYIFWWWLDLKQDGKIFYFLY